MNYLLDTNVALEGVLDYINSKSDCGIIIPSVVLEELNHIKESRKDEEVAYKARRAMRDLFEIKKYGNLNEWISLDNNVSIHVHRQIDDKLQLSYSCNDDLIIGILSDAQKTYGKTTLVSSDINMILKAEGLGFATENPKHELDCNKFYSGHVEILVEESVINKLYSEGSVKWKKIIEGDLNPNQCVTLISNMNDKKQALTLVKGEDLVKLRYGEKDIFGGTKGKNRQQKYLIEMLMDDSIPIIAVNSAAGTGKSYLSTVVGLQKVLEDSSYEKILYVKPMEAMGGKDVGYLPDNKNSKLLGGYSGTIVNVLENIFTKRDKQYKKLSYAEDLIEKGFLQVEAMTFMRGMSYYKTFMIIDEASNISKKDIKNLLTRCGEGSKCCIIGDGKQLDNSKLTVFDNGLQHVIESLKGSELFGTIRLDKSVRSDVAQLCVDRL